MARGDNGVGPVKEELEGEGVREGEAEAEEDDEPVTSTNKVGEASRRGGGVRGIVSKAVRAID